MVISVTFEGKTIDDVLHEMAVFRSATGYHDIEKKLEMILPRYSLGPKEIADILVWLK